MSECKEKFTPGPWFFDPDTGYVDRVVECAEGEEHDPVCEVWNGDVVPKGNGYLIAAALEECAQILAGCFQRPVGVYGVRKESSDAFAPAHIIVDFVIPTLEWEWPYQSPCKGDVK